LDLTRRGALWLDFVNDVLLHGYLFSECFCAVTSADIQKKIAMGTGKKRKVPPEERLSVEKVADRFNQVPIASEGVSSLVVRRVELGHS